MYYWFTLNGFGRGFGFLNFELKFDYSGLSVDSYFSYL